MGNPSALFSRRDCLLQLRVQALAVADGKLKRTVVGDQDENVPRRIQHGGAVTAVGKVFFDGLAQLGRDTAIDVIGNLIPDMPAIQNHDPPALPRNKLNSPPCLVASCGARIYCIIRRARKSRVFTTPWLTPSAAAVSAMLSSSTSRRRIVSR